MDVKENIKGSRMTGKHEQVDGVPMLTDKQRAFADAYLLCDNVTEAAIKAGYPKAGAHVQGSRLLRHAKVAAYLKAKRQAVIKTAETKFDITIERVLLELARIAFVDPRAFFNKDGQLKNVHELDEDTARVLAGMDIAESVAAGGVAIDGEGIKVIEGWVKKIKISDKLEALNLIGKHIGMFEKKDDKRKLPPFIMNIHTYPKPKEPTMKDAKVIDHPPLPTVNTQPRG